MATLNYQWQPPSSGIPDAYNIYVGPSVGQESFLASVPGTQTAYSHSQDFGPFAAYVSAVTGGLETGPSNEVVGAVAAPLTLQATGQLIAGAPAIVLAWSGG